MRSARLVLPLLLALAACGEVSPNLSLVTEVRPGIADPALLAQGPGPAPGTGVTWRTEYRQGARTPRFGRRTATLARVEGDRYHWDGELAINLPTVQAAMAVQMLARDGRTFVEREGGIVTQTAIIADRSFAATSARTLDAVVFAPDNCHARVGTCAYTRTVAGKAPEHLIAETAFAGGVFSRTVRHDPARDPQRRDGLAETARYSVDQHGLPIDEIVQRGDTINILRRISP